MRNWRLTLGLGLVVVLFALSAAFPMEAWAGPGGVFVKAAAKSPFMRWLFVILGILFLPLIVYAYTRQGLGILRTKKDLRALAQTQPEYAWSLIERQATAAVRALYAGWQSSDLSAAMEHLRPDYFESQTALIDRWREEGKRNVCKLQELAGISPLWMRAKTDAQYAAIALLVRGKQLDYLEHVESRRLIKGNRAAIEEFESVWLFTYQGERWLVFGIRPGDESLGYARLSNEVALDHRALQPSLLQPAATQARENGAAAQHERAPVRVTGGQKR